MTVQEHITAAIEEKKSLHADIAIVDAGIASKTDYATVCASREKYYRAKANSVKSDAAKAKWNAIADVWAS